MDKEKRFIEEDKVKLVCNPSDNNRKANNPKGNPAKEGSHKTFRDPKLENTQTDVYYDTECKLPESEVAIPTYDAVVEAKEWVDDANKK